MVVAGYTNDAAQIALASENRCSTADADKSFRFMDSRHEKRHAVVAMSGDGSIVASGGRDGSVSVHDASTGATLRLLTHVHEDQQITCVTVSGDGRLMASCGTNGDVVVHECQTGALVAEVENAHSGQRAQAVAMNNDGSLLAHGGDDGKIVVRDLASGKTVMCALEAHSGSWVFSLALSADGSVLVSSGNDGRIVVYSVSSGDILADSAVHDHKWVSSVAISADGTRFASGGRDGLLVLYSLDGNTLTTRAKIVLRGQEPIVSVALSGAADLVSYACESGRVGLMDALKRPGTLVTEWKMPHRGPAFSVAVSADGKQLASGGHDGRVAVYTPQPVSPPLLAPVRRNSTSSIIPGPNSSVPPAKSAENLPCAMRKQMSMIDRI
eukprot:CAMPEP_0114559160 /NCGR_PEP_ID=MMETSP0114-20121206/10774_1 /TAXON_ID=31324 /ORGANISM="Goniomonas sp, Strain m" /LENGTH=382 /DNA_ID=CAMNT_0001744613 /DNA_START=42 /DNA_END=1190 /DNA_ORIENTATION=-